MSVIVYQVPESDYKELLGFGQLAEALLIESQPESSLSRCQCLAKGGFGWVRRDAFMQLDSSQPSSKGLFTHCFPMLPFIDWPIQFVCD